MFIGQLIGKDIYPGEAGFGGIDSLIPALEAHLTALLSGGSPLNTGILCKAEQLALAARDAQRRVLGSTVGLLQGQIGEVPLGQLDRKSTRLNSSHKSLSRMPSSA